MFFLDSFFNNKNNDENLTNYGLDSEEQKKVKNGDYDFWNFDEEELEEDDYFFEDDETSLENFDNDDNDDDDDE